MRHDKLPTSGRWRADDEATRGQLLAARGRGSPVCCIVAYEAHAQPRELRALAEAVAECVAPSRHAAEDVAENSESQRIARIVFPQRREKELDAGRRAAPGRGRCGSSPLRPGCPRRKADVASRRRVKSSNMGQIFSRSGTAGQTFSPAGETFSAT